MSANASHTALRICDVDWMAYARCRGANAAVFQSSKPGPAAANAAVAICADCPVLERCREYALANAEPAGVWGGLTPNQRAAMRSAARSSR